MLCEHEQSYGVYEICVRRTATGRDIPAAVCRVCMRECILIFWSQPPPRQPEQHRHAAHAVSHSARARVCSIGSRDPDLARRPGAHGTRSRVTWDVVDGDARDRSSPDPGGGSRVFCASRYSTVSTPLPVFSARTKCYALPLGGGGESDRSPRSAALQPRARPPEATVQPLSRLQSSVSVQCPHNAGACHLPAELPRVRRDVPCGGGRPREPEREGGGRGEGRGREASAGDPRADSLTYTYRLSKHGLRGHAFCPVESRHGPRGGRPPRTSARVGPRARVHKVRGSCARPSDSPPHTHPWRLADT